MGRPLTIGSSYRRAGDSCPYQVGVRTPQQEFKSIQDLLKQDSTMEVFGYRDGDTGCLLPLSVEKLYKQVAAIALGSHVPQRFRATLAPR